jgi:hypothetical protein
LHGVTGEGVRALKTMMSAAIVGRRRDLSGNPSDDDHVTSSWANDVCQFPYQCNLGVDGV